MNYSQSDLEISTLINESANLNQGEKSYLLTELAKISPIEKLTLKHSLLKGTPPRILEKLRSTQTAFLKEEKPKEPSVIEKFVQNVFKPKAHENVILSHSILNQMAILGGPVPKPVLITQVIELQSISAIKNLDQLRIMTPQIVNFGLDTSPEMELQRFFEKTTDLFESIPDINKRREVFLNYLSSPLVSAYFNTALTALRHTELQPRSVVLNTLYQIDTKYLNQRQFRATVQITAHLRSICGL
jgi:hypothetical protein